MIDKILLITGGSRGIGKAVALSAAKQGYTICLTYQNQSEDAEQVVDQVRAIGAKASMYQLDVAKQDQVRALFEQIDREVGKLTHLVNNAGIVQPASRLDEYSAERIQKLFEINVYGLIYVSQQAIKRMSTKYGGEGGVIVNVSSVAARVGGPNEYIDYSATKGAVDTITVGLAKELAEEGVRVNGVRPGIIDTDIHASGGDPGRPERLKHLIPLQRPGSADEVAGAIVWLLSDEASYVTGATLDVSGGR